MEDKNTYDIRNNVMSTKSPNNVIVDKITECVPLKYAVLNYLVIMNGIFMDMKHQVLRFGM